MAVKTNVKILADVIYPVGSIYLSVNSTSPGTLFGGTWEQIKDRFLLGCGSTYSNGSTGGEATHKLTINEMPSHNHEMSNGTDSSSEGHIFTQPNAKAEMLYDEHKAYWCTTSNVGGGAAHNNMPPYFAVYMWKRTG